MQLTADYHIHTPYSHGKNSVLENAMAARERGLKEIAITDHGFNHVIFGLRRKKLSALRAEIDEAEKLTGVKVLMGMESNVTSIDGSTDMLYSDLVHFDVFICGIHSVLYFKSFKDLYNLSVKNYLNYKFNFKPSKKLIEYDTKAYINVIKNNPIDVLTHVNFRAFANLIEVAKCCADYGTYIEINTKKHHISPDELNKMAAVGARFLINSDAHSADRVADTYIAEELIKEAGLPLKLIDNVNGRLPNFRFSRFKEKHL